jgi:membrane fusion protein (multidrug efflux system)
VQDCVLRAPFTGDIGARYIDPGVFVRPGTTIVTIVDRRTIRVTGDAPEKDFELVARGNAVKIDVPAIGRTVEGTIARRSPRADPRTRTVHFEIDVPDRERTMPVGTTGIVRIDIGKPVPAAIIPGYAATVRGDKARLFVVEDGKARAREVAIVGEAGGKLFLDPAGLPARARVVTEGRALLSDGDAVEAAPDAPPAPDPSSAPRGGGYGRPL